MDARGKKICFGFLPVLLLGLGYASAAPPSTTQAADDQQQIEACWKDLQKEEPWCTRAILDFYDKPAATVAFFKEHLKPLKIDQKELDDTIAALGNDDEKVWKPAFDKLGYFDPRLNKDVETLIDETTDPLARSRLVAILTGCSADQWKGYDISYTKNGNWAYLSMSKNGGRSMYGVQSKVSDLDASKPQWQRTDRAIVLLQHIGTPDAIDILRDMATGNPTAQPTKIAKVALESLGQPIK